MKKSLKNIFFGLSSLCLLALTSCSNIFEINNGNNKGGNGGVISNVEKTDSGVKIKRLYEGVDENEHEYQIFAYSTTPTYISQVPEIIISFADERNNGSFFLTSSLNVNEHTFTITCLQAFDSQANIRLKFSNSVYGDLKLDYKQKVEGAYFTYTHGSPMMEINYNYDSSKYVSGAPVDNHPTILDILDTPYNGNKIYETGKSVSYTIPSSAETYVYGIERTQYGNDNLYYNEVLATDGYGDYYNGKYDAIKSVLLSSFSGFSVPRHYSDYTNGFGREVGGGFYKVLDAKWNTLTSSQKQTVADNLVDGRIPIVFDFTGTCLMFYNQEYEGAHYFNNGGQFNWHVMSEYFDLPPVLIKVQPIPEWDLGQNANSVTLETTESNF